MQEVVNFAWDGITSFSVKPIRAVLSLGIVIFLISLLVMIYCLIVKIAGYTVEGWTFLAVSIWLVAGVQMLSLGIIGEYVGKVYNETKARPRYIISENLNEKRLGKRLKKRTEKRLVKSLIKNINTSEITNSI